jgi:post-segregation antitoxin (ccd killing protein)
MTAEYDFRKGVRGEFFDANAILRLPIYLDEVVERYLAERAKAEGVGISELVNQLLRKEIESSEAER